MFFFGKKWSFGNDFCWWMECNRMDVVFLIVVVLRNDMIHTFGKGKMKRRASPRMASVPVHCVVSWPKFSPQKNPSTT